mgnify:CR=1 FL=1
MNLLKPTFRLIMTKFNKHIHMIAENFDRSDPEGSGGDTDEDIWPILAKDGFYNGEAQTYLFVLRTRTSLSLSFLVQRRI